MSFFPEEEYSIQQVRQAKKDTFALLESINSTDRSANTVPNMQYVQRILPTDIWSVPDPNDYTPSAEVSTLTTYSSTIPGISFIDVGTAPVYTDEESGRRFLVPEDVRQSNRNFFAEMGQLLHSQALDKRIGCRGLFPSRDYNSVIGGDTSAITLWKRFNEKNKLGVKYLDFCLPQLAPNTNDQVEWKRFATAHLLESTRYTKAVYAFLSVKYHPEGDQGDTFVDSSFWTSILEQCLRCADGVMIFGDTDVTWSAQQAAPWWAATQTFISDLQAA